MVLTLPPQSQHITTISMYSTRTKKKKTQCTSIVTYVCGNDNVYTKISNAVIFTKIISHNNSFCFEIFDRENHETARDAISRSIRAASYVHRWTSLELLSICLYSVEKINTRTRDNRGAEQVSTGISRSAAASNHRRSRVEPR